MRYDIYLAGQKADLTDDTSVTLEFTTNIFNNPGKINLGRSYTIKLPRTLRNAKLLDAPEMPAHDSKMTRRFLPANIYRNGFDLLGDARAYILATTPEAYEITIVSNALEALQALSQSDKKLNDLPNLPYLPWIGPNGHTPDYSSALSDSDGAFFADYIAGLGSSTYPSVNTATHPCVTFWELFRRVMLSASVPYTVTPLVERALRSVVLLAAPHHAPTRNMDRASGSKIDVAYLDGAISGGDLIYDPDYGMPMWDDGWDPVQSWTNNGTGFFKGESESHRVFFNFEAPSDISMAGVSLVVRATPDFGNIHAATQDLLSVPFVQDSYGYWYAEADEPISLSNFQAYKIVLVGDYPRTWVEFTPHNDTQPVLAVNRVHDSINLAQDNRFPLAGNLPDIKQWEFVTAAMALLGLTPSVRNGKLDLRSITEALSKGNGYDWSNKVDAGDDGPERIDYTIDGWARNNVIKYKEEDELPFSPNASLVIDDTTLAESRDMYSLPFAASNQSIAQHYKFNDKGELEDVDISPRVFTVVTGDDGRRLLRFSGDLYGDRLVQGRYSVLADAVRKPIRLTLRVRLNEVDLKTLDFLRPVYLRQYGHYYAINKIQTSETDLCKVELIQLP